jgi:hypothetical protein
MLVDIGEKKTMMAWREPGPPVLEARQDPEPGSLLTRALQRKERRMQQRAGIEDAGGSVAAAAFSEPGPSSAAPTPEDVQQLPRYANVPSTSPGGEPVEELSQRLAELGSIPQVLQALQNLIRHDNTAEPALPQYDEGNRLAESGGV